MRDEVVVNMPSEGAPQDRKAAEPPLDEAELSRRADILLAPAMARPLASFRVGSDSPPGYALALVAVTPAGEARVLELIPNSGRAARRCVYRRARSAPPPPVLAHDAVLPAGADVVAFVRALGLRKVVPANDADHRLLVLRNGAAGCRLHVFVAAGDTAPPFFLHALLPHYPFLPEDRTLVMADRQAQAAEALGEADLGTVPALRWFDKAPVADDEAFAPLCALRFGPEESERRIYFHQPSGRTPPPLDAVLPDWLWCCDLTPGQQQEIVEAARRHSGQWTLTAEAEMWRLNDRGGDVRLGGRLQWLRQGDPVPFNFRALVLAQTLEALAQALGRGPMRLAGAAAGLLGLLGAGGAVTVLMPGLDGQGVLDRSHVCNRRWDGFLAESA